MNNSCGQKLSCPQELLDQNKNGIRVSCIIQDDLTLSNPNSVDGCLAYYKGMEQKRQNLPYEIDGVVYKVKDLNQQEELGFVPACLVGRLCINLLRKKRS